MVRCGPGSKRLMAAGAPLRVTTITSRVLLAPTISGHFDESFVCSHGFSITVPLCWCLGLSSSDCSRYVSTLYFVSLILYLRQVSCFQVFSVDVRYPLSSSGIFCLRKVSSVFVMYPLPSSILYPRQVSSILVRYPLFSSSFLNLRQVSCILYCRQVSCILYCRQVSRILVMYHLSPSGIH